MTTQALVGSPNSQNRDWYEEFNLRPRFPRTPVEEIRSLLNVAQEPQVFLAKKGRQVDIVFRVPLRFRIFKVGVQRQLAKHGVTLSRAFEDILWNKPAGRTNTTWSEVVKLGFELYRATWAHFFELAYLGHFHPAAEKRLRDAHREIESVGQMSRRGRKRETTTERASLNRRYKELLRLCAFIHKAAERATLQVSKTRTSIATRAIRRTIWENVRKNIHGVPHDGDIFGGASFKRVPYGIARLHDPLTWKPSQLAISLLSSERKQKYKTIEKKIKPTHKRRK